MARSRPVLVILAMLALLLVGMAIQNARIRAGQTPGGTPTGTSRR